MPGVMRHIEMLLGSLLLPQGSVGIRCHAEGSLTSSIYYTTQHMTQEGDQDGRDTHDLDIDGSIEVWILEGPDLGTISSYGSDGVRSRTM